MSQAQFADLFHVTRQTVSNWENNRNYPDMFSLKQISDTFQVSFDMLLKDDLELMSTIDQTEKKADGRKRLLILVLLILCGVTLLCFYLFCKMWEPTEDGDRIHTEDNVRMLPGITSHRTVFWTAHLN